MPVSGINRGRQLFRSWTRPSEIIGSAVDRAVCTGLPIDLLPFGRFVYTEIYHQKGVRLVEGSRLCRKRIADKNRCRTICRVSFNDGVSVEGEALVIRDKGDRLKLTKYRLLYESLQGEEKRVILPAVRTLGKVGRSLRRGEKRLCYKLRPRAEAK